MFDLLFLGTAATTPTAERSLPALLVSFGSRRILVDCGEGTQRQIMRSGIGLRNLSHVLLTHGHLDHVLGLGGLIATLALYGLDGRLVIAGGPATLRYVRGYLENGVWAGEDAPIPLDFAALQPGPVAEDGRVRVSCFPVRHGPTDSLGYLFEVPPRRHLQADRLDALGVPDGPLRRALAEGQAVTLPGGGRLEPEAVLGPPDGGIRLAVVGDTEETESLVDRVRGVDALVIEATFLEEDAGMARQRDHLTAADAARLAARAGIDMLLLTHISGRYAPGAVEAEARAIFPRTRVVDDLDRVTVPAPGRRRDAS